MKNDRLSTWLFNRVCSTVELVVFVSREGGFLRKRKLSKKISSRSKFHAKNGLADPIGAVFTHDCLFDRVLLTNQVAWNATQGRFGKGHTEEAPSGATGFGT